MLDSLLVELLPDERELFVIGEELGEEIEDLADENGDVLVLELVLSERPLAEELRQVVSLVLPQEFHSEFSTDLLNLVHGAFLVGLHVVVKGPGRGNRFGNGGLVESLSDGLEQLGMVFPQLLGGEKFGQIKKVKNVKDFQNLQVLFTLGKLEFEDFFEETELGDLRQHLLVELQLRNLVSVEAEFHFFPNLNQALAWSYDLVQGLGWLHRQQFGHNRVELLETLLLSLFGDSLFGEQGG